MRAALSLSLVLLLATPSLALGVDETVAAKAETVNAPRLAALAPGLRQWVRAEARRVRESEAPLDVVQVQDSARSRLAGQAFTETDLEALVLLVLHQVAKEAKEDLRAEMEQMDARRKERQAMREAQAAQKEAAQRERDAAADAAEGVSVKLAMYQDRYAAALEQMSSLLEKSSDTSAQITANLK